ncbi:MAG: hypothetical protein ABI977_06690 [Acidobacteriota bacterium]
MTNEEMERAIDFLVQQQAQFSADLQASRVEFDQRMTALDAKLGKLTDAVIGVTAIVGQLVQQQAQMAQKQTELEIALKDLAEKHTETHERLNIFINVVERYISERQNGHQPHNPANPDSQ